jgi:hypothetical protein
MKRSFLIIYSFILIPVLYSQENPIQVSDFIENNIENSLTTDETEPDYESIVTELENLRNNPVNLNNAQITELERFWFLNDFQVQSLLDYRKSVGQIQSIYELNYVFGFSEKIIDLLGPLVVIGENQFSDSVQVQKTKSWNEILLRTTWKNNSNKSYKGSPVQLYSRLKGNTGNKINYCLLAEKDAGEEFAHGSNGAGFDFYSGFLQFNSKSVFKNIIVGDYRARAGQGLLIWNGYSTGKSAAILSLCKRNQGISGNASKDEYNFLRGVATVASYKNLSLTLFASDKQLDGSLDSVENTLGLYSISTIGYHRTNTEILRKGNIREQLFGSMMNLHANRVNLGLNWLHTQYEYPFLPSDEPYKLHSFTGKTCNGVSADYRFLFQKIQFYGEAALSNNSIATLHGINFLVSSKFNGTLFYRNYPVSYYSPYSNTISENTSAANEKGVFAGFSWQTPWELFITAYSDIYSFPWLSYYANQPIQGKETTAEINFSPVAGIELVLRYHFEQKGKNYYNESDALNRINDFQKQNLRIQGRFPLSETSKLTTRFEWCQSGFTNINYNKGYLVFTDFNFQPLKSTSMSCRYTFFNIEDFDARIYAYESDVLYSFSVPSYSGNGQKIYLVIKHQFGDNLTAWLRYEFTQKFDLDSENTQGVKGQVIVKF